MIQGGYPLQGCVSISGAKNSALPILAACVLSKCPVTLLNIPHLHDITTMMELLAGMGTEFTIGERMSIEVNARNIVDYYAPYTLASKTRASILILGPLLSRYGQATVSFPGGCDIGSRPINLHLQGLQAMGAQLEIEHGYIRAQVKGRLKAANILFDTVTVTGTEHLMMAAVLAKGKTILKNAAREPEVVDLAHFLNTIGAKILGAGTDTITIEGVSELGGGSYKILPDRIEAATYLIAAACTRGMIRIKNIQPDLIQAVLNKLQDAGADIVISPNSIELDMRNRQARAIDIATAPYPAFPTDLQAQITALNTTAEGTSTITETIFEKRFRHVEELIRMGADIKLLGNTALCTGVKKLTGAQVVATDLRASVSLVLAGLMAEGKTIVHQIYHLDRGYECIEEKLLRLGAKIKRILSLSDSSDSNDNKTDC